MQCNLTSLIEIIPNEILGTIGAHLSFQDLNRLVLTGKVGEIWANSAFDLLAKELLCQGKTTEERKLDLAKLYCEVPFFIRSLHDDIDKIKDKAFENGNITIEYDEDSFRQKFLINYASSMFDQILGCEQIAKEFVEWVRKEDGCYQMKMLEYGVITERNCGIKIRQTPSNHISNVVSSKLIEGLKKASEMYFIKLCTAYKIADLDTDKLLEKDKLDKYKNKCAFVIYAKDSKELKLHDELNLIYFLLHKSKLVEKVDVIGYNTLTGVYGEKEDIEKFITILHAQQSPNVSMSTLKQARGITDLS